MSACAIRISAKPGEYRPPRKVFAARQSTRIAVKIWDGLKVGLELAPSSYVQGGAMKRTPEGVKVAEAAPYGLKPPPPQCPDERLFVSFDYHPFFVQHQHVHAYPLASHIKYVRVRYAGLRGVEHIPAFKHLWNLKDSFRIDK